MLGPVIYAKSTLERIDGLSAKRYAEAFLNEACVTGHITDEMYDDLALFEAAGRRSVMLSVERVTYEPVRKVDGRGFDASAHFDVTGDHEIRELLFEGPGELRLQRGDRLYLTMMCGKEKSFFGETVRESAE